MDGVQHWILQTLFVVCVHFIHLSKNKMNNNLLSQKYTTQS